MIFKNSSKSKLTLAFISIVITFFVWQQGLRDSLNRPSVSFDISQKEQEIAELSVQSIPVDLKKFFIINDPVDQINKSLSEVSFEELTERNKLIRIITSESNDSLIYKNISKDFKDKNFKFLIKEIEKKSNNNLYKPNSDKFDLFKDDRFLYHLLSKKLDFDDFIRNDDVTFYYHLIRWKDESFEPLSTLCKMFIDRDLLKASDISFLSKIDRLKILAFASKLCVKNGYDSEIFCGIKERSFKGFESNNALKIWDGTYQSALENSSALIKTLMRSDESSFIIYPDMIKNEIKNEISLIKNNS